MTCPWCQGTRSLRTRRIRGQRGHVGRTQVREHRCLGCERTYMSGQRVLTVADMEELMREVETVAP